LTNVNNTFHYVKFYLHFLFFILKNIYLAACCDIRTRQIHHWIITSIHHWFIDPM